jgi:hypothetical protein
MIDFNHRYRHGVYQVDGFSFVNKVDALKLASKNNKEVYWNFNDEVYSAYDWSLPIETSLPELYKQRAQHLRDKYDYLSLFFSGGADSTNVLHSFIDNDIFLDEIIILRPFSQIKHANTSDKTLGNLWSEIEFAAIPHLKKYIKDSKTSIRIIDIEETTNSFLTNPRLLSQWHQLNYLTPFFISKNSLCFTDQHWNSLYNAGKSIAHISGCDKPIINFYNGKYTFQFNDSATTLFHFEPTDILAESEMIRKQQYHEFFYWTPEMPQLLIKQCQVVKQVCETDLIFKMLFTYKDLPVQDRFVSILHHIYPSHVIAIRNLFTTNKPSIVGTLPHQQWLANYCSSDVVGKFKDIIDYSKKSIDTSFFIKDNSNFKLFVSKQYYL